jgi:hypothetical protein
MHACHEFEEGRALFLWQEELHASLLESVAKVSELKPFDRAALLDELDTVPAGEHMHAR